MRAQLESQWALYADWCESWDEVPMPATAVLVARFLRAFPGHSATQARRVRAIHQRHVEAGVDLDLPGLHSPRRTVWTEDPKLAPAWVALAQMPRYGAPARKRRGDHAPGLRGRRDGFLIVLVGVLGFTRQEARTLTASEVDIPDDGGEVTIRGHLVPRGQSPDACPACAVTRWLRVVGALARGDEALAYEILNVTLKNETIHDCDQPLHERDIRGRTWRDLGALLLRIDHHGWTVEGEPLSPRSISDILQERRVLTGRVEEPTYVRPVKPNQFDDASSNEVYNAAGDAERRADDLYRETARLLELMGEPLLPSLSDD